MLNLTLFPSLVALRPIHPTGGTIMIGAPEENRTSHLSIEPGINKSESDISALEMQSWAEEM